ncbi:P68 family surface lipoprotein [Mycoplasma sp. 128]
MTKKAKFLTALAAIAVPIAGVAGLVSCSNNTTKDERGPASFEQDNDGLLRIYSPWSATNYQGLALQALVDFYNKSHFSELEIENNSKVKKAVLKEDYKGKNILPVVIVIAPSGYSDSSYISKLKVKAKNDFYNLIIQYPTVASVLQQYQMGLNFDSLKTEINNLYSSSFLEVNKLIAGNKNNSILTIPASKSGEMLSINKPVTGMLISELVAAGAKIDTQNSKVVNELKTYWEGLSDDEKSDKPAVKAAWNSGKYNDSQKSSLQAALANYTMNDNIFTDYEDLLKFTAFAKRVFPNNKNYVLGMDSYPNAVYTIAASLAGQNEDSLINKDASQVRDGGFNYKNLLDQNTPQGKRLKAAYDLMKDAFQYKGLWIGGEGAYGSNELVIHNLAISLGSTAGWSKTFTQGSSKLLVFGSKAGSLLQGSSAEGLVNTLFASADQSKSIVNFGKYKNKILPTVAEDVSKNGYDYSPKTADDATKLKAAVAGLTNGYLIFSSTDPEQKVLSVESNGKIKFSRNGREGILDGAKFLNGTVVDKNGKDFEVYWVPSDLFEQKSGSANSAQKEDMMWLGAPSKAKASSQKTFTLLQGPSIIGVHSNDTEDKATLEFVKWMLTVNHDSDEITFTNRNITKTSAKDQAPVESLAELADYLAPTKSKLSMSIDQVDSSDANDAIKIISKELITIEHDSKDNKIVEDVAAPKSQRLRSAITGAGKGLANKAANGSAINFNAYVKAIKESLSLE